MVDSHIGLKDGRTLAFTDIGEPGWPCVLFFHGAPSSRLRIAYLESDFSSRRVRVVSPDRPSYGGSSPQPGRSLAHWPSDVAALADALEIDRFIVAGHSSGGAYALACAAFLSGRVSACITLAGVTNMGWPGAWEHYPESECELMRRQDEAAAIDWCATRFGADGSGFMAASGISFSEPDEELYRDETIARLLALSRAEAFRQGVAGYAQDVLIQGRPWPFEPAAIAVPVHILHGEADTMLPFTHSYHTATSIPGSTLRVLPGHGHFTILSELAVTASTLTAWPTSDAE